jgi:hypothetical protein
MARQYERWRAVVAAVVGGIVGLIAGVLIAYGAKRNQWLFPLSCPGIFLLDLLSLAPATRVGVSMPRVGLLAPANAAAYGLLGLLIGVLVYRRAGLGRPERGTGRIPTDERGAVAARPRQERFSVARSLATAAAAFLLLIVAAAFLMWALLTVLVDSGFDFWGLPGGVVLGMLTGMAFVLAYVPCRRIYTNLRWRTIEHEGPYSCRKCGYNLTGNVSGVCPECGAEARSGQLSVVSNQSDGTEND